MAERAAIDEVTTEPAAGPIRWTVEASDPGGQRYLRLGGGRWTGTPPAEGPVAGLAYASFAIRAVALAIDIAVIAVASEFLGAFFEAIQIGFGTSQDALTVLLLVQDAVTVVLIALGFVWAWTVLGCSPGQLVAGLRTLRRSDGRRLGPQAAVGRVILLLVPWLVLSRGPALPQALAASTISVSGPSPTAVWLLLAVAVVIWYVLLAWSALEDPRGQGWHDKVSGSVVVGAME